MSRCRDVAALVENLRDSATISYDINVRVGVTGMGPEVVERVERLVALCDVVKASDEDLELLWPDLGVEGTSARLRDLGAGVVVATRGADGASYQTADHDGVIDAVGVEAVDTIGAGDTFSAAMLAALAYRNLLGPDQREVLLQTGPSVWQAVLRWAARAAMMTVSRPGADPPRREDLV